jgi:sugar-specific transcriptional regulator TrmB
MKKIRDFLSNLGLTETEINIYVKLLELGRTSVSELARTLEMNRVTAHFTIQGLIDKGLITHVKEGRSRELTAQPPEALKYLIEQKDKEVKLLNEQFTSTLPMLTGLMPQINQESKEFDVKFFEGIQGVRAIYREVLKAKELRSYVNIQAISSVLPENPAMFPEATRLKHLKMWEIIENSPKSQEYLKTIDPHNYFYKFIPTSSKLSTFDYMIFDGKIAMISGTEKLNGLMIINTNLYLNARTLFEIMWNLLPDPS